MKTTRLYAALIYVLALLAISTGSFAQDNDVKNNKTPEEKAKITSERMKSSLNLSDDQYTKIYNLNLQRIKDYKEFKESKSKSKEDRENKKTEYKNSLKSILTEDQLQTMIKMHKDKKMKKDKNMKKEHGSKKEHKKQTDN